MRTICMVPFLVFYLSANAQLNIGARGGISIPNLKGNNEQSKGYTSRLDGYGGLLANFRITRFLYLQPEINFSPQGGQRKGMQQLPSDAISGISLPPDMNLYANFKSVTILNYLEIPILAKIVLGQKLKYFACFGPHIAFLLEAKTKTSGNSLLYLDEAGTIPLTENNEPLPAFSFNSTTSINESIKKVNAGVQGGLGIQYPLGPGSIFLEGRAIIGLINIQTHPEIDGKNKTGSLAVSAGYQLKIK
ncbi:MAG: porin family protein [Bacteroidota bacterium]|nr:porin family protein [Bacteroidota bacterium]